jgi:hypothetical protein
VHWKVGKTLRTRPYNCVAKSSTKSKNASKQQNKSGRKNTQITFSLPSPLHPINPYINAK